MDDSPAPQTQADWKALLETDPDAIRRELDRMTEDMDRLSQRLARENAEQLAALRDFQAWARDH